MKPLEKFGKFVIENFRDRAIDQHLMMQRGELRSPAVEKLQSRLASLPPEHKELVSTIVADVIDVALHDILFGLQDAHDRKLGIELTVDGTNIAGQSGMLQGEPLGANGWIANFSKYPPSSMLAGQI